MNHTIKGYCIVINNLGSEFDPECRTVKEAFQNDLGFHYEIYNNLSAVAIRLLLCTLAEIDQSNYQCLTVAMFCKGDNQALTVCGSDDAELSIVEIEEMFSHKNCLTLSSKPKLFLYNLKYQNVARRTSGSRRRRSQRTGSRRNGSNDGVYLLTNSQDHERSRRNTTVPNVFRVLCPIEDVHGNLERRFAFAFWNAVRRATDDNTNTLEQILQSTGVEYELHEPCIRRQLRFYLTE